MTIFYSVLFTLLGTDPKDNHYVSCLQLQVAAMKRTGMLKHTDKYYVLCDAASAKALTDLPGPERVRVVVVPTPQSLKGGMMMKYLMPFVVQLGDESVVYLDLDVFPVKPALFNIQPDTLVVYPEGLSTDTNYSGGRTLKLEYGCSGGFFAYRSGPRIEGFFKTLLEELAAEKEEFYTLDQPTFNHLISRNKEMVVSFPHQIVSYNGNNNRDTAIFWNMCGDPGDGLFHFRKMLAAFLALLA